MKTTRLHRLVSTLGTALVFVSSSLVPFARAADRDQMVVQVDRPGAAINPHMFGIFFEDINFAADGGIYAELVKNRSFEFPDPLMGWKKIEGDGARGTIEIRNDAPLNTGSPHYLRVTASAGAGGGVSNEGFRGIGIGRSAEYDFSVYARRSGNRPVALRIELVGADGKRIGAARVSGITQTWTRYATTLRAAATDAKARLNLYVEGGGAVDLDMVSLFPKETWKHRPNGLRPDLVRLLKEMQPGFVRFPGGCIVEGHDLNNRYQWKATINDLTARPLLLNRWNDEFKHRPTPDYFQSFGLGFYEYFLLCEDINAEPLPVLNCGMACQFNTGQLAPLDALDPYIQDALDLIEFANGPSASRWGSRRAAMGHAAPFNLKMMGVGNEQWGPQYVERYERFSKALKAAHPEIKLVSSAGPAPAGEQFEFLWKQLRDLKADLMDEHYYMKPEWFLKNASRYDSYDRSGPKVFAGEFAAQSTGVARPDNRNTWECALAEAAFMTGLERNGDVVVMSSYAPLFAHVEAWQWTPNLIWFDNLRSFGTPSYYVQKLFGANGGTRILPVTLNGAATNGENHLYASALSDERGGEVILKIVNASGERRTLKINLAGAGITGKSGAAVALAGDLKAENSLEQPLNVAPVESKLRVSSPSFDYDLAPNSLVVLRLPVAGK
jgi:alpha-N-arabinofuranosidase